MFGIAIGLLVTAATCIGLVPENWIRHPDL